MEPFESLFPVDLLWRRDDPRFAEKPFPSPVEPRLVDDTDPGDEKEEDL